MGTLRGKLCMGFLLLALVGGCGSGAESVYEPAACAFPTDWDPRVQCGYLTVPEDRSQPEGRSIRLHVAILPATGDAPSDDPLVYLHGGPGVPVLQFLRYAESDFARVRLQRSVIFFDQRGVGFSEPSLDCPEIDEIDAIKYQGDGSLEETIEAYGDAMVNCRDRLVDGGVNLSAYNSAASAADVHDLMLALGYERYNLYGVSYGTRLAQTVMRDHPDGVRSVVLDSVLPLEVDLMETFAANGQRALELLFQRCAADEVCSAEHPDMETSFYALVDQLNGDPLSITANGANHQIDGYGLIGVIRNAMYETEMISELPGALDMIREGRTGWLSGRVEYDIWMPACEGVRFSVQCSEEAPFNSAADAEAIHANLHPAVVAAIEADEIPVFQLACDVWDVDRAGPVENRPVVSDIPTLILGGDYDPVTPPAFGKLVAENLANSQYFEFPGYGHGVATSGRCGMKLVEGFLEAPMEAVDSSCLETVAGAFVNR